MKQADETAKPPVDFKARLEEVGQAARAAARKLALLAPAQKNRCLEAIAELLLQRQATILAENAKDLEAGKGKKLSAAMLDRLKLTPARIEEMAKGLRTLTGLADPIGRVDSTWLRPNGLEIRKVRVPIGVIAIIYESRPNVTVDAAGLCLKAGNAVVLRGGSEAIHSNLALAAVMAEGLAATGLPAAAVQVIPWTDRAAVNALLRLDSYIDLVMPRGGESLIRAVVEHSTIPVIKHYKGVCHIYVDKAADQEMALAIIENAKCQRPGVCNAVEKVLVHRDILAEFAPKLAARLGGRGVELRGDAAFRAAVPTATPATAEDWSAEYLDLILTVGAVAGVEAAAEHIARFGSAHSDAIVTADKEAAQAFTALVDSAAVYVNASTRFTDGSQFGMGAEIGISTDKIHARGPMGVEELTSYKYVVIGKGQIRG
ncbi:MAG: glutamate-5-semialdehyde dehydrogenase [Lentisphaeria bacterium]|jgi:glutamate-5-semialdehyde dehydrogenase